MTKKVISIIFLIVTSLIFATSVFATLTTYGLPGTDFNLVFNLYEPDTVLIYVYQPSVNEEIPTDSDGVKYVEFSPSDTAQLMTARCRLVVQTNCNPSIKITFNPLKSNDVSLPYTVILNNDEGTDSSVLFNSGTISSSSASYDNLKPGGKNLTEVVDYSYPLTFYLNVDDAESAVPGDYVAIIDVEVTSK